MHVGMPIAPDAHSAKLPEPTDRTLHHPAEQSQSATMFRARFGNDRLDASPAQLLPVRAGPLNNLARSWHI